MILAKLQKKRMKTKLKGPAIVLLAELMELTRRLYKGLAENSGTEVADKVFDTINACRNIEDDEEVQKKLITAMLEEKNKHDKTTDPKESQR